MWLRILLSLPAISVVLLSQTSSDVLPKNCTQNITNKVTKSVTWYQDVTHKGRCKFLWVFKYSCTKTSKVSKTRMIYVRRTTTVSVCCNGSVPVNSTSCTKECPEGEYGNTCEKTCTCPSTGHWKSRCDKTNGTCFCEDGFTGKNCTEVCSPGSYGSNCSEPCLCHNGSKCNSTDGSCTCTSPGWTGQYCDIRCPNMTFGISCERSCNCTPNETCNPVDGTCTCKPGLRGEKCKEVCKNFTFGVNCSTPCECLVNNSDGCHPVTGICKCKPGWEDNTCSSACDNGTFGAACRQRCLCDEDEFCDPVTGSCYKALCFLPNTENCEGQIGYCPDNRSEEDVLSSNKINMLLYQLCSNLSSSVDKRICFANQSCKCSEQAEGTFCETKNFANTNVQFKKTTEGKGQSNIVSIVLPVVVVAILISLSVVILVRRRFNNNKNDDTYRSSKIRWEKDVHNIVYEAADKTEDDLIVGTKTERKRFVVPQDAPSKDDTDGSYDILNRHSESHGQRSNREGDTYSHAIRAGEKTNDEYDSMNGKLERKREETNYPVANMASSQYGKLCRGNEGSDAILSDDVYMEGCGGEDNIETEQEVGEIGRNEDAIYSLAKNPQK